MIFDPVAPQLMINPSEEELQDFFILCICVAGKKASVQRQKVTTLLSERGSLSPFGYLRSLGPKLETRLKEVRIGQYKRIVRSLEWLASNPIDLRNCSLADLENVPGVGPKTSRFFVLYARNEQVAVLDRHVMRWLRRLGYKVPTLSPQKDEYLKWEKVVLEEAKRRNMNPLDLDTQVWLQGSKYQVNGIM